MTENTSSQSGSPSRSVGQRIVRAGFVVGIAHLLFKLSGLFVAKAMAQYVDKSVFDAVYAVAFEACVLTFFLIGEEVIGPTFLPVFMRQMDTKDESTAWNFANAVLTLHLLVLLGVVAAIMMFPGAIVQLCTAWDAHTAPDKFALATQSLRWLAPALICLSLGSTTYMILNGYKRFFLAAFGDASWRFCVIIAVVVGMGFAGMDHRAIILGLVAGSAAKLLTHLAGMMRELRFLRPSLALRNPAVRAMLLLMLPLIAGILIAKVRDIVNNVYVLSHLQTDGLMQANSFGRKLYQPIGWLIPYSLSIAMFPFFCELVDKDDQKSLGGILTESGRMLLSLFIPLAMVCVVVARPVTSLLFKGGEFGPQSVAWTSMSMACYTLALPAAGIEFLLMQAFFANRRMISVTVVGVVFSIVSILISYVGVVAMGATGSAALAIIAGGFTLSRTLKSATLVIFLKRFVPCFRAGPTAGFLVRTVAAGAAAAGVCLLARNTYEAALGTAGGPLHMLGELAVCGIAACIGFVPAVLLLRIKEPFTMVSWAIKRIHERKAR